MLISLGGGTLCTCTIKTSPCRIPIVSQELMCVKEEKGYNAAAAVMAAAAEWKANIADDGGS